MMTRNMQRGMMRIWVVVAVLWVGGMGWHEYHGAQDAEDNSLTIALSKDSQIRIDASGIKKDDQSSVQMQRLALVFLPPLALLLIFPLGTWLARGFKPEGQ